MLTPLLLLLLLLVLLSLLFLLVLLGLLPLLHLLLLLVLPLLLLLLLLLPGRLLNAWQQRLHSRLKIHAAAHGGATTACLLHMCWRQKGGSANSGEVETAVKGAALLTHLKAR